MLATSMCREVHFTVLPDTSMRSQVPRCLFGRPNPRETADLLQEALDHERSSFRKRWGIDPCSEEKENDCRWKVFDQSSKRNSPYSKQTNIHDYWPARKVSDTGKKSLSPSREVFQQNADPKGTKASTLKNSN